MDMGRGTTAVRQAARILAVSIVAMITAGCYEGRSGDDAPDSGERVLEGNGFRLNGFRLNGFRLNGFRLNGFRLNGDAGTGDYIELKSIELASGGAVVRAWLTGGDLHVEQKSGKVLSGVELVGAVLDFGVVEGEPGTYRKRKVRIAGVAALASDPDVLLYELKIKEGSGRWEPLCVDDLGAPQPAFLIGDAWDPVTGGRIRPQPEGVVTLACRDAALGKCVEWGYYPWEVGEHHQACTRAARADYCGDGTAHTVDGLTIHVLDDIGVQDVAPDAAYTVEAEWGPDGATCLDPAHERVPVADLACAPAACGEPFASGGLIQTGVVTI